MTGERRQPPATRRPTGGARRAGRSTTRAGDGPAAASITAGTDAAPGPSVREAMLAPFVAPTLDRASGVRLLVLVVRIAMPVWAYAIGAIALRWGSQPARVDDVVTTMQIIGVVIGAAWFVTGAMWSVARTRNVYRLDGRYPSLGRAIRSWVYAPVWIALMTITLVQIEPHPEFDARPIVIIVGLVVAMLAPYRLVQRVFRSLVRVQPDAAVFVLYVVDTIAFGVVWWQLVTWPAIADVDRSRADLLGGSMFAAGVAMMVGLAVSVYLDRETDRSEDTRVLALRARHDHRLARLQGLDPMDGATRWALWLARQTADTQLVGGAPVSVAGAPVAAVSAPAGALRIAAASGPADPTAVPVASTGIEPEHEPDPSLPYLPGRSRRSARPAMASRQTAPAAPPADGAPAASDPAEVDRTDVVESLAGQSDPAAPPVTAAVLRERVLRAMRSTLDDGEPAVPDPDEALIEPGAEASDERDDPTGDETGDETGTDQPDAVTRALQRRLNRAPGYAERIARRAATADAATPLSERSERLAARVGADLERGGGDEFAARVRELSEQYQHEPSASSELPVSVDDTVDVRRPPDMVPPRLIVIELNRVLALLLLVVAIGASVWVLVDTARLGTAAPSRVDRIDLARSLVLHALSASHVFALGWMLAVAVVARRIEPSIRRWPFALLVAISAPLVAGAVVFEPGEAGEWSLTVLLAVSGACISGLVLIAPTFAWWGRPRGPLAAWAVDVLAVVVAVAAGPLRAGVVAEVARDALSFAAIVVGLALMVAAVVGALAMSQFEDALRSSPELAVRRRTAAAAGDDSATSS